MFRPNIRYSIVMKPTRIFIFCGPHLENVYPEYSIRSLISVLVDSQCTMDHTSDDIAAVAAALINYRVYCCRSVIMAQLANALVVLSSAAEDGEIEGDQLHWLGCALYVACRSSTADTVSRSGVVHGNCVGLTRLLRLCKLSLIQFFNKSKKWADMANLPSQFHDKIERLERNFAVSMVIFKKFQPIFTYMFLNPMNTTPKQPKSRKQRSQPCTPSKVFDFCWTLFVCVKAEFSEISDDLFNSYHLLLACCDMIFANAFMAGRRDLLNPQFPGKKSNIILLLIRLPNNYYDDNFNLPSEPPCVIDHLCQKHDGLPVEAKTIKVYTWRNHIRKLFEKKPSNHVRGYTSRPAPPQEKTRDDRRTQSSAHRQKCNDINSHRAAYDLKLRPEYSLRGDPLTLTGILEPNNFELNCKAINKIYDAYVLNVGDFDERIFLSECKRLRSLGPGAMHCHLIAGLVAANRPILKARNFRGEDSNSDIGTPIKMCDDLTEKLQTKKSWNHQYGALRQLAPPTPLTGREFLKGKEDHQNITPVSTATQSVSRLHSMLLGRQAAPSDGLIAIFNSCTRNPRKKVEEHVKEMGTLFCTQFTQQQPSNPPSMQIDFPRKRLQLGETLYYKLLENILLDERKKKPKDFDFSNLLEQDIFHQTLFACCLEIVIYSYNSQRKFPWILEALNLEPYYFYKVIEIIVRVEDQLSRDMVKHLNLIEEQILEALAWRSDSPLWESIKSSGLPVPSCEDACLPSQLYDESTTLNSNPVIRRLALDSERLQGSPQSSPISSVSDRFQSPVPSTLARKKLFTEGSALRTVKPGQSLLQNPKTIPINIQTVEGENGQRYIPISYVPGTGSVIIQAQPMKHDSPEASNSDVKFEQNSSKPDQSASKPLDQLVKQEQAAGGNQEQPLTQQHMALVNNAVRPRRAGSLGLFFRKFYHLASVRMQDLCKNLAITDRDLKRKIWTCFEYTIIHHMDLMKDRHLDQILMCSVYVICKVAVKEKTFTDIMRCYRHQPQAASHVYRSVLLRKKPSADSSSSSSVDSSEADALKEEGREREPVRSSSTLPATRPPSAPPTPTQMSGTFNSFESEDRGDLIKFYNTVYVQKLQSFAVKFSTNGNQKTEERKKMSPLCILLLFDWGEEGREREPVRSSSTLPATRPPSAPPTPTQMSGTFNSFESEDRGDLIKFYNTVYVQKLQSFAVKFSTNGNQSDNLTLSPLPLGKSLSMSPCRRISERHNVVIRSLENISTPLSPNTPEPLSYRFSRSPAKDLKAINAMIQIDTRKINKRLLDADDDAPPVKRPTPVVAKKLQNLIGDRLGQVQD
uniref:Retinoblastoma-like protein 1 n=1 Tax=Timema cristinae TaxID=61476 RepID=A0A7R9CGI0_TIMCR|nr:unnamed protein product [Timema cristinae]